MINYYSFIKQNVQLQEILNSFKDVDASSVFVHRALLISLPYGVDSSFIASLLYDSIAPRFFDGKTGAGTRKVWRQATVELDVHHHCQLPVQVRTSTRLCWVLLLIHI